jgi:AcrR family transcriptional regulator
MNNNYFLSIMDSKISTKDRIYKASLKIFSEKGFETTIVKDILKESNISRRTFYKYFNSKEDILKNFKEDNVSEDSTILAVINKNYPEYYEQSAEGKLDLIFEKAFPDLIDPVINSIAYQAFFSSNLSEKIGFNYLKVHLKNIKIYEDLFEQLNYENPQQMAKLLSSFFQGYILEKHIEYVQKIDLEIDKNLKEFKKLIKNYPKKE